MVQSCVIPLGARGGISSQQAQRNLQMRSKLFKDLKQMRLNDRTSYILTIQTI